MILTEQQYKNLYRNYFHGSKTGKLEKIGNTYDFLFLTTDFVYSAFYACDIDAYARQYGSELRELYPEENTDDLFKRIFSLNIKRERLKEDLEYILSHLTIKNQKFFLRNIYDYLENEED